MIFNQDIITQAISELKKIENNLNDSNYKLRFIANKQSVNEHTEWHERLVSILKTIKTAREELSNHIRSLQNVTELYEAYEREAANAADNLPELISNHMIHTWITEVKIHGIDNIQNELNPMLCNHLLQHEEWLYNHMFNTICPDEGEKAVR